MSRVFSINLFTSARESVRTRQYGSASLETTVGSSKPFTSELEYVALHTNFAIKQQSSSTAKIMRYQCCKKADLVAFANSRGVTVSSISKKGPSHREYIAALNRADRETTFRFLDLPAELRNLVYDDLLILRDSFSCFPQILQTCKEINKEATTILYGENYIDIKIFPDGIFVHGQRCGQYQPTLLASNERMSSQGFATTPWPDYLRRAQFLRLIVSDGYWNFAAGPAPRTRIDSVGNVTYSLCQMLRKHNSLRVMRAIVQPDVSGGFEGIEAMLYPFHLIDDITLDIVDSQDHSLANFFANSDTAQAPSISAWAKLKAAYDCARVISKLETSIAGTFAHGTPGAIRLALAYLISAATRGIQGNASRDDLSLHVFHNSIQEVRTGLEICNAFRVHTPPDLLLEVYRLLCLEIDLVCQSPRRSDR